MKNWDELRTAYEVAKSGTVTAAAEALNIHRATVIRHIDSLEAELGTKLFQRHGRGYTPTDMGNDLLQVAGLAESEFSQLKARAQGHNELHGEFIITSLAFITPFVLPTIQAFQQQHPKLHIRYLVGEDLLKLEYGQAHVAIRSGNKPTHPDYVVSPFVGIAPKLYAHQDYIEQYGMLSRAEDFTQHRFVMIDKTAGFAKTTQNQWLQKHIPTANIVLQSNSYRVREAAMLNGMGIGIMYQHEAEPHPALVEISYQPPAEPMENNNWIVTHGDLHRTEKVQRFLQLLKQG